MKIRRVFSIRTAYTHSFENGGIDTKSRIKNSLACVCLLSFLKTVTFTCVYFKNMIGLALSIKIHRSDRLQMVFIQYNQRQLKILKRKFIQLQARQGQAIVHFNNNITKYICVIRRESVFVHCAYTHTHTIRLFIYIYHVFRIFRIAFIFCGCS